MGCRVCRARKVKCDGRPNGCRNCERLQLDCVADDGTAAKYKGTGSSGSPRKIRTYRSCQNCRLSKTKCNGDRPKCSRCTDKHADCVYDGGAAPRWARNLNKVDRQTGSEDGSSSDSKENSVDVSMEDEPYFDNTKVFGVDGSKSSTATSEAGQYEDSLQTLVGTGEYTDNPETILSPSDPNAWLLSPNLPTGRLLRRVVDQYFANIHPLRCFAFVHKPSFMRQLDKGTTADDETALLHIICAHGAKFYVLTQNEKAPDAVLLSAAGNQWAKRAEYLLLANFGKITVQRLMTAILLHEFHFRAGEYTQALMISGLAVRMAHALKINTEYNSDIMCTETDENAPSVVSRESRRRLMWACYILDAWSGSGIDQLTLLRENDIKIQLPSNERNFGLRIPSVTETLGVGHVLQFLPPAVVPRRPAANMGIMAYYIRIVTLWKKTVRYVNRLDAHTRPWLPESDFAALDADLKLWRRELPDFVEYSTETIYARLDSNQLGALVLIHCTYHHNYLELYKLSMPDLFKLSKPLAVPPEHVEFFQSAQENCYYHAHQIADILAEAADHGARLLSDSLLPYFVYDSSRVMLYYVARLLDPNREDARDKVREAINAVESNNSVLQLMSPLFPIAKSLSNTINRWLTKIRHASNREELVHHLEGEREPEIPGVEIPNPSLSSPGANPDLSLPSISLHSLARTGIGARRAADRLPSEAGKPASGGSPWPVESPASTNAWSDRSSVAQQLIGLSKDTGSPMRTGLQHERPVTVQASRKAAQAAKAVYDGLDLDDLQNFLSWDMYGIRDMGDPIDEGVEDMAAHAWAGAI